MSKKIEKGWTNLEDSWTKSMNLHNGLFLAALFMRRENTTMFTTNEMDFIHLTHNLLANINDKEYNIFIKCRNKNTCETFFLEFNPTESNKEEWWDYNEKIPQSYINLLTEVGIINKK
jgi:hypothetical protein